MNSRRTRGSYRTDSAGGKPARAVISLFSGAGGLDLGLENAGFHTALCVERDADCRATLRHNRPDWNATDHGGGDIRAISTAQMLEESGLKVEGAALVVGGAPCQPFSNIGSRAGTGSDDGTLFREFMRVVQGFRPKGFIFENVAAITHSRHREVVEFLQSEGARLGYGVTVAVLNAADFGVPQKRLRMFALGCRSGRAPSLPVPEFGAPDEGRQLGLKPWRTVGSAIMRIPKSRLGRPDNLCMQVSDLMLRRYRCIRSGTRDNFKALPTQLRPPCWRTGKHQGSDTFGRLLLDEPSVTIRTCGYHPMKGRYIHPTEHRGLNTAELARLQGFPDPWEFRTASGRPNLSSIARQIGNAVPPPLAAAIGRSMLDSWRH